jgi:hypothetical protein
LDCEPLSYYLVCMKAPQRILCCALAVTLSSTGWARLGETLEQCEARYGLATRTLDAPDSLNAPGALVCFFSRAGFKIVATFHNGKAGVIFFEKEEQDASGNPMEISQTEVESLLESNNAGKSWQPASAREAGWNFNDKAWLLEDKSALAVHDKSNHRLVFTSIEFAELQDKVRAAKEEKSLEGF